MKSWPVPLEVLLDTGVVIGALFPGTPDSDACAEFCSALASAESKVYISQVMRFDFARAIRRLATKPGNLPGEMRDRYNLDLWGANPLIRQRWLTYGVRQFARFFRQFPSLAEVPVTIETWRQSIDIMAIEALDASDAMHLATARALGVGDFATTDSDFRRVTHPRIHLLRDLRSP